MEINKKIDLEDAKERFMGNEELYKRFLFRFVSERTFLDLKKHIEDEEVEEAFEVIHAMKGVVGNLSLIELYNVIKPIVEVLRDGNIPTEEQMGELTAAYEDTQNVIRYIEENDVRVF